MTVTRETLGSWYVVGAGALFSGLLLANAYTAVDHRPSAALVALAGLVPALSLAGAHLWLDYVGLDDARMWQVAQWAGLGIGILTVLNVGLLVFAGPVGPLTPVLVATSIAIGGAGGLLLGTLIELRHNARRLSQSNDVLHRILRHNLRNDLTVVLGHLGELEDGVEGADAERIDRIQEKIDEIITTVEKAKHVDLALSADGRQRRPVDVVPWLEECVSAVTATSPEVDVRTDFPDEAWVHGDWLVGTVLENLIENAVEHSAGPPRLHLTVRRKDGSVRVEVRDRAPPIPTNERVAVSGERETPLQHATGVGLWLVRWIVETYDGSVDVESVEDGGNALVVELPAARPPDARGLRARIASLFPDVGQRDRQLEPEREAESERLETARGD